MQILHQWNSSQRTGVCPLLTSSETSPSPYLKTQSRSQRTALAIWERKTFLHFENTPHNQQQINTAPVSQCCKSNTPSAALLLPLHHRQSCQLNCASILGALAWYQAGSTQISLWDPSSFSRAAKLKKEPSALLLASKNSTFHS